MLQCTCEGKFPAFCGSLRLAERCANVYDLLSWYTLDWRGRMRTNIEIDDQLIERALKATGLPTKRAVVEEGLRLLIKLRGQAKLRESFGKYPLENNLEESRQGRSF